MGIPGFSPPAVKGDFLSLRPHRVESASFYLNIRSILPFKVRKARRE